MGSIAPTQAYWLVQPLLDAGLEQEEIRDLLVRLSFFAIVGPDHGASDPMAPVRGRPVEVRAAWAEMIDRMIALDERGG